VVSITESQFTDCSIANAVRLSISKQVLKVPVGPYVVNGGAGASIAFARNVSVVRCVFDAGGGADASDTSAALLVIFSGLSPSHVLVADTVLKGSQAVLSISCADQLNNFVVQCPLTGLAAVFKNSSFLQTPPSTLREEFDLIGSTLMTMPNAVSLFSAKTRMKCASAQFAVFASSSMQPFVLEYACRPCPPFQVSLSADEVWLEDAARSDDIDRCFPLPDAMRCPFGITLCQTFVDVSRGFWTQYSSARSATLLPVQHCPRGYCDCGSSTCRLSSPLSIEGAAAKSLCSGQRTGPLCGGCLPHFTQSMDGVSCISNEQCTQDLWWVWMLSVLGYAIIGFIIVPVSADNNGALSCLLFYVQMATFSSSPHDTKYPREFIEYFELRPIVALLSRSCFARDMGAYEATAARLVGPVFVLVFSVVWTWLLQMLQPLLQQRRFSATVSYSGTFISAILFVFSSTATVVFSLVQCTSYTIGGSGVIYIDGTVSCFDGRWKVLIAVVALLCLCPVAFAAALLRDKLPASARAAVCRAFTERMFYWGAVTLGFRLLMSLTQFFDVGKNSNVLAFARSCLSTCMLVLLVYCRPYKHQLTFWFDFTNYACLVAQFGLQALAESFEFFGVDPAIDDFHQSLFLRVVTTMTVLRWLFCTEFMLQFTLQP
jgi:hypothetical protein